MEVRGMSERLHDAIKALLDSVYMDPCDEMYYPTIDFNDAYAFLEEVFDEEMNK
jgi:hypothetical protein